MSLHAMVSLQALTLPDCMTVLLAVSLTCPGLSSHPYLSSLALPLVISLPLGLALSLYCGSQMVMPSDT